MLKKRSQKIFLSPKKKGGKKSYAEILKTLEKREVNKKAGLISQDKNKNNISPKIPNRYLQIFLGYCYSCNNFGHTALNCRTKRKESEYKKMPSSIKTKGNKNMFSLLQQYDIECYNCNNHGHMARDCKLKNPTRNSNATQSPSTKQKKYWREKEEHESSMIALCATKNQNLWHLDSGCLKHMTGDSSKFITLKDNKGKVAFGDSLSSKI